MTAVQYAIAGLAAIAAGIINALAGGGTLITFPVLIALGLPAITANVTNTVALCPGYLGGTLAQRDDLANQMHRLWFVVPAGIIGGLIGGILLVITSEKLFTILVPFLILFASTLLAMQNKVRNLIIQHQNRDTAHNSVLSSALPFFFILPAAIYGGYFGAGLSVILLAVLSIMINDSITRLNALKQVIALVTNVSAAIFFIFSGQVDWLVALIMAVGALAGGVIGGKLASKVKPAALRLIVVVIGFSIGIIYLIKNFS